MYPTLGHLFSSIFGIDITFPIPTYGTMLALAFVAAYLIASYGLKSKEKEGLIKPHKKKVKKGGPITPADAAISAFFGFIIGFKFIGIVVHYELFKNNPQEFLLSLDGSWIAGIIVAGLFVYQSYRRNQKEKKEYPEETEVEETVHPYQLTGNIILWAAIAGVIGAKIFHQLEYPKEFLADPFGALFSTGGLTFYGGLIAGAAAVIYYAYKKGIDILQLMDVAAPAILLAYATGRVGCQLSGDGCWGVVNLAYASPDATEGVYFMKPDWLGFLPDWMFAFNFPHNVVEEGYRMHTCTGQYCHVLNEPVFPTSFYETTINAIFFFTLILIRKRLYIPGALFSIMLIMNGFERFFIEKIRVNSKMDFLGMRVTQAEIISTCLVIVGIVLIIFLRKRYKRIKNMSEVGSQKPKEDSSDQ